MQPAGAVQMKGTKKSTQLTKCIQLDGDENTDDGTMDLI